MSFGLVRGRLSQALVLGAALVAAALCIGQASAGGPTFRSYNADQGLTSLGGDCLVQDHGGFVLVCTEDGVFSYNGRKFDALGPDQGLRQGGYVYDIALAASGRIAVRFTDEVLVADRVTDDTHSPLSSIPA